MASIFKDTAALDALCQHWRVKRLSLFGSRLSGLSRADSDFDLLVEFETGAKPGLIGLAELELALSELLGGVQVDLRTAEDLSRHFRDEVLRVAAPQYAA